MDTFIDFANDGRITLVLEHVSKASLRPDDFIFQGKTMFASPTPWTSLEPGQDGWYVGDFNGDHKSDILRSKPSGAEILLSDGVAGFGSPVNVRTPSAGNGSDQRMACRRFQWGRQGRHLPFYLRSQSGADVFLSMGNSFWQWHEHKLDARGRRHRREPGMSAISTAMARPISSVISTGRTCFYRTEAHSCMTVWSPAGNGSDNKWYVGDFNGDGKADIFRYLAGISGADVFPFRTAQALFIVGAQT